MMQERIEQLGQQAIAAIETAVRAFSSQLAAERELLRQMLRDETLTEGRIVHYAIPMGRFAGECRPAIVVKVYRGHDKIVDLQVFTAGQVDLIDNLLFKTSCMYNAGHSQDTWHWIEDDGPPDSKA